MFGSKSIKYLILVSLFVILMCPAFSDSYEDIQYRKHAAVQEEFGDYMTKVREKISDSWTPPDVVEEGHAAVVFKVDKDGYLISSYIKESSGNALYDESALNAIREASPYAVFPENASRDYITVMYSFDSSLVNTSQVKELVNQAEKYINRDNQTALRVINQAISSIQGDPASYFLYARRSKINKLMGNIAESEADMAECKRLKALYNNKRIAKCKEALSQDETPFAYFTLANAYELAGDYVNALYNIDKAISMTELNNIYKRYRAELVMKSGK